MGILRIIGNFGCGGKEAGVIMSVLLISWVLNGNAVRD